MSVPIRPGPGEALLMGPGRPAWARFSDPLDVLDEYLDGQPRAFPYPTPAPPEAPRYPVAEKIHVAVPPADTRPARVSLPAATRSWTAKDLSRLEASAVVFNPNGPDLASVTLNGRRFLESQWADLGFPASATSGFRSRYMSGPPTAGDMAVVISEIGLVLIYRHLIMNLLRCCVDRQTLLAAPIDDEVADELIQLTMEMRTLLRQLSDQYGQRFVFEGKDQAEVLKTQRLFVRNVPLTPPPVIKPIRPASEVLKDPPNFKPEPPAAGFLRHLFGEIDDNRADIDF